MREMGHWKQGGRRGEISVEVFGIRLLLLSRGLQENKGRGWMDSQRLKAEEAQSSTIAQFTTGVLSRSPENKRARLKKRQK